MCGRLRMSNVFILIYVVLSQTMLEAYTTQRCSSSSYKRVGALSSAEDSDSFYACSAEEVSGSVASRGELQSCQQTHEDVVPTRYQACVSMIR